MRVCAIFLCPFCLVSRSETACFGAVIGHQFRIRLHLFITFPSAISSKKHQSAAVFCWAFCLFFASCGAKLDRPSGLLGRSFCQISKVSVLSFFRGASSPLWRGKKLHYPFCSMRTILSNSTVSLSTSKSGDASHLSRMISTSHLERKIQSYGEHTADDLLYTSFPFTLVQSLNLQFRFRNAAFGL